MLLPMRTEFSSPWSRGLKVLTGVVLFLLAYVAVSRGAWAGAIAISVVAASALFAVRGYRIGGRELVIKRLGWSKNLDLANLERVEVLRDAMAQSLRIFGIGGLFSYVGLFRNSRLGWYRAYATDPSRAVVLSFRARRVVVTPDDPEQFSRSVLASRDAIVRA
jgi:hypothetical protein